jgi:hypothetical protein
MVNDRFFMPALRTTLLLIVMIIPVQFVLSIIMALVIQANLKGSGVFLYIFAIALGVLGPGGGHPVVFDLHPFRIPQLDPAGLGPDRCAGDLPVGDLQALDHHRYLAGGGLALDCDRDGDRSCRLQAISREVLEASEVFGANLWQRLRYIILPLAAPQPASCTDPAHDPGLSGLCGGDRAERGRYGDGAGERDLPPVLRSAQFNVAAAYASFILLLSLSARSSTCKPCAPRRRLSMTTAVEAKKFRFHRR